MKFGIRAREGWKSNMGEAYYTNRGFKINVISTDYQKIDNLKLYYKILKVLTKHYDLEYLDRPTVRTGKAGTGKHNRIVFTEEEQLIEKLMDDPSLKELKGRIMKTSESQKKAVVKYKKKLKIFRQYRKGNICLDCKKNISAQAFRCHKCAGKCVGEKRKGMKYKGKKRGRKKGIFKW